MGFHMMVMWLAILAGGCGLSYWRGWRRGRDHAYLEVTGQTLDAVGKAARAMSDEVRSKLSKEVRRA